MKNTNLNNGKINEILEKYFNREEITEFSEKIVQQLSDNQENSETIFENINLKSLVDLLITFALLKLEKQKLVEFLLELGSITIISGEFQVAIDVHNEILRRTKNNTEYSNINANALLAIGEIFSRQAQWKMSFSYLKKSKELFLSQKDFYGCARCENLMGIIYGDMGNLSKSKEHFENSLSYLADNLDSNLKANVEVNLGIINTIVCNYDDAFTYYNRSLTYYEKAEDKKRLAEIRQNIGMLNLRKNNFADALNQFDLCIDLAISTGYLQILEMAYLSKAFVYIKIKDYVYAEKFADSALKICCKINDRLSIADIYKIKGIIHRNLSNFSLSENYFLTSLRFNQELQNKLNEAETSFELALLYKEIDRVSESKKLFSSALKYFKKINAVDEIKNIEIHLN